VPNMFIIGQFLCKRIWAKFC